jgi:hypothetical protein
MKGLQAMATKTHFTVVRNAAYRVGDFKTRSRHNERENDVYQNGDVVLERSNLNVHYKQNFSPDGSVESYQQTFERLLSESKIVKRGLKEDAKVFDELVFDVNSDYFEQNGGYDFAVRFFEEAYRLAVKEVGSEDYILSAVLHADERNSALSEKLGYDVYHYHLHVVYVPVVEKEVLWSRELRHCGHPPHPVDSRSAQRGKWQACRDSRLMRQQEQLCGVRPSRVAL